MSVQYICDGAIIKCSYGNAITNLRVLPDRTVTLTEGNYANVSDHESMENIPSFGLCSSLKYPPTKAATDANHGALTPMRCKPGTVQLWEGGNNSYLVRNYSALQSTSYCKCIYGGIIKFVNNGQQSEQFEMEGIQAMQKEDVLDQVTDVGNTDKGLDAIDFIPVVGSIRDIGEGIAAGSLGMVAFGTVFLILDVAGLFTAGTANVGITATKTAAKAGMKSVAKSTIKTAIKNDVAKESRKQLLKFTAKDLSKGTPKISAELAEELEKALRNAGRNIFEVNTKVAETGAKNVSKSPKAEQQVLLKTSSVIVKKGLVKVKQQMKDAAKIGREYLNSGMKEIKKYLGDNEVGQYLDEFSKNVKKIDDANKDIARLKKITKYINPI